MDQPLVSVIIPLYNRKTFIAETLQSVCSQTYPHWEALVVDDGSTDGSCELVEQIALKKQNIKLLIRNRLPKGASTCRNMGAELAAGQYLIFLDSDDVLAPHCLERRIAVFKENKDCDFLVFPMLLFKHKPGDLNTLWNINTKEDDIARFLRGDALWQTSGPIYKKSTFLDQLTFDENLAFWQDYELHTRSLILDLKYKKCMDMMPDCYHRRHEYESISQGDFLTVEKLQGRLAIYYKITSLLQDKKKLGRYAVPVVSMLFFFSRVWAERYKNLAMCRQIWKNAYEQNLVNKKNYFLGYGYFYFKYLRFTKSFGKVLSLVCLVIYFFIPDAYKVRQQHLFSVEYKN